MNCAFQINYRFFSVLISETHLVRHCYENFLLLQFSADLITPCKLHKEAEFDKMIHNIWQFLTFYFPETKLEQMNRKTEAELCGKKQRKAIKLENHSKICV